jgi:hypothetical protein
MERNRTREPDDDGAEDIKTKVGLLELAMQLGNVARTCRIISRR